jgi:hypothetical protein
VSPALPPEVRRYLEVTLHRQSKGRPPYRHWQTLARAIGGRHETLVDVADWLERRGLLAVPRIGRYRHWQGARLDAAKARALLAGGAS